MTSSKNTHDGDAVRSIIAMSDAAGDLCLSVVNAQNGIARAVDAITIAKGEGEALIGQADALRAVGDRLNALTGEQNAVADRTRQSTRTMSADVDDSIRSIQDVAGTIKDMTGGLSQLESGVDRISAITETISKISKQTNLLALNATIEAARAGEAGRGFAVVASEVKQLSSQVNAAALEVKEVVAALAGDITNITEIAGLATERTARLDQATNAISEAVSGVVDEVANFAEQAQATSAEAHTTSQAAETTSERATLISTQIETGFETLRLSAENMAALVTQAVDMMQTALESGADSAELRCGLAVRAAADRVGTLIETALTDGRLTQDQLFDQTYVELIPGDATYYTNGFTPFADQHINPILDETQAAAEEIGVAAVVDANYFSPTHETRFNNPPRKNDPDWNKKNARCKYFKRDPFIVEALESKRDYRIHATFRDYGSGAQLIKVLSAPITIRGRHWGAIFGTLA